MSRTEVIAGFSGSISEEKRICFDLRPHRENRWRKLVLYEGPNLLKYQAAATGQQAYGGREPNDFRKKLALQS